MVIKGTCFQFLSISLCVPLSKLVSLCDLEYTYYVCPLKIGFWIGWIKVLGGFELVVLAG
jgi:hypothetical protein